MHHIYWHLYKILWVESLKRLKYSKLSLSRTPLGPAISVCLGESHIKEVKKRQGPTLGVRFTEVSVKRESTALQNQLTNLHFHLGQSFKRQYVEWSSSASEISNCNKIIHKHFCQWRHLCVNKACWHCPFTSYSTLPFKVMIVKPKCAVRRQYSGMILRGDSRLFSPTGIELTTISSQIIETVVSSNLVPKTKTWGNYWRHVQ